jgi:hypothetical protein
MRIAMKRKLHIGCGNNLLEGWINTTKNPAFVLNNFFRAWGDKFIYDEATLTDPLLTAGFSKIRRVALNQSEDTELQRLENAERLPPGFLELETMTFEAINIRDQ